MIVDGKQVKVIKIYLEDFKARKYETITMSRADYKKLVEGKMDKWLSTINLVKGLNYKAYILTGENHLCKFCGGIVMGKDKDKLCDWCAGRFKTTSYKQFKANRRAVRQGDTIDDV